MTNFGKRLHSGKTSLRTFKAAQQCDGNKNRCAGKIFRKMLTYLDRKESCTVNASEMILEAFTPSFFLDEREVENAPPKSKFFKNDANTISVHPKSKRKLLRLKLFLT